MGTIYIPMTMNVLVLGHIKILRKLIKKGDVIVGLLTSKALKGYKKELTTFKDRLYILESLDLDIKIVPQESLDPTKNLKKYKCNALASGDGFEKCEIDSAKELGVKLLTVNSGCKIHSSDIK